MGQNIDKDIKFLRILILKRGSFIAPQKFAPYPVEMPTRGFERVTDEGAKVKILEPEHPLFNAPNKITERDFDGWVQERGTYFFTNWDSHFKPLLACHDPGETDKMGGEV